MRHQVQETILKPCLSNILQIEALIRDSALLNTDREKDAALIVSTEVFDNIVEHADIPNGAKVSLIIRKVDFVELEFKYKTTNFDKLLKAVKNPRPYIDKKSNRYRGLGLLMVENLTEDIKYITGDTECSICIIL